MVQSLEGYVRQDGEAGFRNLLLVVPLTGCLQSIATRIADSVPGAVPLVHGNGCDFQGSDGELMATLMGNLAVHPNVGGVLFVTMGCAAMLAHRIPDRVRASGRLVAELNMHTTGGTTATVRRGVELATPMADTLARARRRSVPLSSLVIGTKCGASNPDSFQYCHPVVGRAMDRFVDAGATVVLSEDCELYHGAPQLAQRAVNPKTAEGILAMARGIEAGWRDRFKIDFAAFSTPAGGKDAAVKRSLEHAAKAGTRPIQAIVDMSERVKGPGLVILNAPNTDLENTTCLAAAGCHVIVFTTGRGTVVGSPASITVKVTATQATYQRMEENIDLDVSAFARGSDSLDAAADRVVDRVVLAANGLAQKAEMLRHFEIAFPLRGVTY